MKSEKIVSVSMICYIIIKIYKQINIAVVIEPVGEDRTEHSKSFHSVSLTEFCNL